MFDKYILMPELHYKFNNFIAEADAQEVKTLKQGKTIRVTLIPTEQAELFLSFK